MSLATFEVSIIIPKEATNLVTNPTPTSAATGYTAFGAGVSVARVNTQTRRNIASVEITTATGVASGVYYTTALTIGTTYSFSADILDVAGQTFNLFIASDVGGTLASTNTTWTGTGYWKRRSVTWLATGSGTFYLFVTRSSVASTTKFYVDGFQLETGAVSTYLDGNQLGFVTGETAYRWNGAVDASTSWRSGQTRSGGTYLKLSSYLKILAIVGLGMGSVSNIAVASSLGGGYYQDTLNNERAFSLVANINKAGDYALIEKARAALIDAVKPDLVARRQPLLMQIDQLDSTGLEIAETLQIPALYESGLEMDGAGNAYNEKLSLNFRAYVPYIRQDGAHRAVLGFQESVANAKGIVKRGSDGIWGALSTGANNIVQAIAPSIDGGMYIGGQFTNLGDADGDHIVKWNGSAFSSLSTGANAVVYSLAVGADGTLYVGGDFTDLGSAGGDYIASWNGSAWSALGTGANFGVLALAIGPDGTLYAGGGFTQMGGVADTAYIARWNGTTWAAMGTGMDAGVYTLAVGKNGHIFAGGNFTQASGVTGTAYVAEWTGSAWVPLSTGMNNTVNSLYVGPDGTLYAGGGFTTSGGITTTHIARWNGASWQTMGTGGASDIVKTFLWFDNQLYAGGQFVTIGGISTPDSVAAWNGSSWMPIDIDMAYSTYSIVNALGADKSNNFYVGGAANGTATSATVTVPSVGSAVAYPILYFIGPGTLYQLKNYTTGKAIYFNLTLNAGEIATLNLDPQHLSFKSSFRGNIMSTILPGSDLNFMLQPGSNNISAYLYGGTSAASGVIMVWKDQYWSIDGAVR